MGPNTYAEVALSEQSSEALDADLAIEVSYPTANALDEAVALAVGRIRIAPSAVQIAEAEHFGLGESRGMERLNHFTSDQHTAARASIRAEANARRAVLENARRQHAADYALTGRPVQLGG